MLAYMSNEACLRCHSQVCVSWITFIAPVLCTLKIGMQISWCHLEGHRGKKVWNGIKENILLVTAAILTERCKHKLKILLMRVREGNMATMHAGTEAGGWSGWRKALGKKSQRELSDYGFNSAALICPTSRTRFSWDGQKFSQFSFS